MELAIDLTVSNIIILLRFLVLFLAPLSFILFKLRKNGEISKKLETLGGPPTLPLLGNAHSLIGVNPAGMFQTMCYDDIKNFGRVFRVWILNTPQISIASAEYAEKILQGMQHHTKSSNYRFLHAWMGHGLLTSKDLQWRVHRKILTPGFHFNILHEFLHIFSRNSKILTDKFEDLATSGEEFNVFDPVSLCALDIICESSMGAKINAQLKEDSEYVSAIRILNDLLVERYFSPLLRIDWIYNISSLKTKIEKKLTIVNGFSEKVIEERKKYLKNVQKNEELPKKDYVEGQKRSLAFIDLLLLAQMEGTQFMTDQDIRDEVSTFMFEGHDTVTTATCWTLFMMGTYPDIQEKVAEELKQVFGDSERAPTMSDLAELKFLERCIKETLRLFPSVPFFERNTLEDANLGDGLIAPAGCIVTINTFAIHRDPKHFPDPEKFDPDRFLPENSQGRHPYAYLPFSAGPRNCIGQKFALMEEKVVVSSVLRRFVVQAAHKVEDAILEVGMVLRPQNGLTISLKKRLM